MPETSVDRNIIYKNKNYLVIKVVSLTGTSLVNYMWTIIYMPNSLRVLCLTNLFCWMSLICFALYFTDFVGEVVYGGDPKAPLGSEAQKLYDEGVQFGCWGMYIFVIFMPVE